MESTTVNWSEVNSNFSKKLDISCKEQQTKSGKLVLQVKLMFKEDLLTDADIEAFAGSLTHLVENVLKKRIAKAPGSVINAFIYANSFHAGNFSVPRTKKIFGTAMKITKELRDRNRIAKVTCYLSSPTVCNVTNSLLKIFRLNQFCELKSVPLQKSG